jgi:hypothetical protein
VDRGSVCGGGIPRCGGKGTRMGWAATALEDVACPGSCLETARVANQRAIMRGIRKLGTIGGVTLAITGAAVGYALGLVMVLLLIGGSVYRTECFRIEGAHTHGWQLGENLPYLTGAEPRCVNHSLTRYVLGKVGATSDVDK